MSKVIDNYAVRMDFDNARFESNVKTSLSTIDRLKKSLKFDNQTESLRGFEKAANQFDLGAMESSLSSIEKRFSTFGIIGMRAIENLTDSAMRFVAKTSSTIKDSIITGGINRAMNVENAHFMLQGLLHDKEKVQAVMDTARSSVDNTAYSYDAAAKAASMFAASGMDGGKSLELAMKALADTTAATNSNYEDMALIFTQISGKGRLMGDELLQLSSRGMNAASMIAKYFREVRGQANITEAEVREMTSKGQIDFKTFAEAMEYSFEGHAKKANETFQGVTSNIRAALAKIGEGFISLQDETDGFNESLIAQNGPLVNTLNAVREKINEIKEGIKPLQKEFLSFSVNALGSIEERIKNMDLTPSFKIFRRFAVALRNLFNGFASVVTPIGEAFNDVFSPNIIVSLLNLTKGFKRFTEGLRLNDQDASNLYDTFSGIFSVLNILKNAFTSVLKAIAPGLSLGGSLISTILSITGAIGRWLTSLDKAIQKSKAFEVVGETISGAVELIKSAFDSVDKATSRFTKGIKKRFKPLEFISDILKSFATTIANSFDDVLPIFKAVGNVIGKTISIVSDAIGSVFKQMNFDTLIDLLNTGVLLGIGGMFKKFFTDLGSVTKSGMDIKKRITGILDGVRDSLKMFQKDLEAITIQTIAISIGILAASLLVLSTIDSKRLAASLGAVTAMLIELMAAMKAMSMITAAKGMMKIATSMIAMSIALLILAAALKKISSIEPEKLAASLISIAILMTELVAISMVMSKTQTQMVKGSIGLIAFAIALNILANAVSKLANINPESITQGLIAIGVLMGEIAAFSKLSDSKGLIATGIAMIAIATSLNILASAVERLGNLSPDIITKGLTSIGIALAEIGTFSRLANPAGLLATGVSMIPLATGLNILTDAIAKFEDIDVVAITRGLTTIGIALTEIGLFATLVPIPNLLAAGPALLLISIAITQLSVALNDLGGMTWEEVAKGLITLGGALTIFALSALAMQTALPGAVAMLVMGAALRVFAPALMLLASLSLAQVGVGLVALAGSFLVFGAAAFVLAPVTPIIIALAAAMTLFGVGIASVGLGISLAASGFLTLAAAVTTLASKSSKDIDKFLKNVESIVTTLIGFIPKVATEMAKGVIKFATVIGKGAPKIAKAGVKIVSSFLATVRELFPDVINTGIELLICFLDGVGQNIRTIVDKAVLIITEFINGIAENMDKIVDAGYNLVTSFIKAIGEKAIEVFTCGQLTGEEALRGIKETIKEWITVGKNAVEGFIKGLTSAPKKLWDAASNLGKKALEAAQRALGEHSPSKEFAKVGVYSVDGFLIGFEKKAVVAESAVDNTIKSMLRRLYKSIDDETIANIMSVSDPDTKEDKKKKTTKKSSKSSKSTSSNSSKKDKYKWTGKDAKEAVGYIYQIFKEYTQKFDAFNSELLNNGKITIEYLASSIKDTMLSSAMQYMGADVFKDLNKQVDKEYETLLKKNKQFKKNGKLSEEAKTELRNKAAKNVAEKAIKEYTEEFKDYKKVLKGMTDKKTMKTISSIPSAVAAYVKNYNKSFKKVKGVISSLSKQIGGNAKSAVESLGQKLYMESDEYKQAKKEVKSYGKQLDKIYSKAQKYAKIVKDKNATKKQKQNAKSKLKELAQQEKQVEKSLKKVSKQIAKGPAKAIEQFRDSVKETVKDFLSLSNINFSKVINGFDRVERSTNLKDDVADSYDIFSVSLSSVEEAAQEAADAMGILNVSVDTGINLLERFSKVSTVSVRRLMKNATSQLKAYQEFQNGIQELRNRGLNSEFVDELQSQGVGSMNYLRGFLKMSAEEIAQYNSMIAQKTQYEAKATEDAMKKQVDRYEKWSNQLTSLTGKIPEQMLKQLKENGVDGADFVDALIHMDDASLARVASMYTTSASKAVASGVTESTQSGYKSFLEGVRALAASYEKWNSDLAELSTRGLSDAVINRMRELGLDQTKDYVESMLKETSYGLQEINNYFAKTQNNGQSAAEVWLGNIKTTNKTYKQWINDMKEIAGDLGKNNVLYKALQEMGWEAGAEYANAFVNASESEKEEILEAFNKQQEYNEDAIMASLNQRINSIKQWNNDLKALAGRDGMTDAFMKELIEMGPEAYEQVRALTEMSSEEFKRFASEYSNAITTVPETISNDVTASYARVAADAINSFSDNISSDETAEKANKSVNDLNEKVKKNAKKKSKKTGKETGEVGIKALKEYVNEKTWKKISELGMTGLVMGVISGKQSVLKIVGELAQAMNKKLKKGLDAHSPSREWMRIGEDTGEGLVIGLAAYQERVAAIVGEIGDTAVETMSKASKTVNDAFNGNIHDISPTITPVLDTSALYNEVLKVNALLGSFGDINVNLNREANKDVVSAINNMEERFDADIAELSRTMSQLQVVMDSGTLVGELAGPIDTALYQRTAFKQRGM